MNRDQSERLLEQAVALTSEVQGVKIRLMEVKDALDRVARALEGRERPWWRQLWPR